MFTGPRYRGPSSGNNSSGNNASGSSERLDPGTRALVLGVIALVLSWVPLINIVAAIAALMAVAFGLLSRWPTGWLINEEPNEKRGLWAVVLGAIALVIFVISAVRYSSI